MNKQDASSTRPSFYICRFADDGRPTLTSSPTPSYRVPTGHYKEVVSRVSSEQFAEFDHVLIDVNQVRSAASVWCARKI